MSELRRDPVSGRFVIIAPERQVGSLADPRPDPPLGPDADLCPFCEGHEALAGREILAWRPDGFPPDGPGWQVRVVANREPALRVESHLGDATDTLLQWFGGLGAHEVIIESPQHQASFERMTSEQVGRVLWAWRERMRDLRRDFRLESFLVVKNVGWLAGATLAHPHSQLLALPLVPQHLEDELAGARDFFERTASCVFCELMREEQESQSRLVSEDERTVALTPFASRVPFELCVLARDHQAAFEDVSDDGLAAVAARLRDTLGRLDRVLGSPPYTLLLHSAPVANDWEGSYHWHLEILPRLTPVPGLAWDGGIHINPVSPEEAAQALREGA